MTDYVRNTLNKSSKEQRSRLAEMTVGERVDFLARLGRGYLAVGLDLNEMADALKVDVGEIWTAIYTQRRASQD